MSAAAGALGAGVSISQISTSSQEDSTSKPKVDSRPLIERSLLLSDPSIPKSTYASSSKSITGAQSSSESGTQLGLENTTYQQQLGSSSPLSGYDDWYSLSQPLPPSKEQIAGTHYVKYDIQPVEYIVANGLSFLAGNVIKYTTRYKDKNGAEDIRKAIHYLNMILEFEYADAK